MEKSEIIQIRLTKPEKEGFVRAAEIAGISVSAWTRERLRAAAIRDLENARQDVPFIKT